MDFATKKTPNLELEDLHRMPLPQGKVLLCDTLPKLSPQKVEVLKTEVMKRKYGFFPLFIQKHWIAGVPRHNDFENESPLMIQDLVPSLHVHRDIDPVFQEALPELVLQEGW